jgi:murein L,D-transpeptidase YcbB/YkuD
MGRVKLFFQEGYFIHGTPDPRSLGRPASHGCVRLSNSAAVELAVLIQQHASSIDSLALASLVAGGGKTRVFTLERAVPLEIRYDVAVVEGERLVLLPDIYRLVDSTRVAPALAALHAAGFDTTVVDRDTLRALIPTGRGRRASIPLGRLVPAADFRP